MLSVTADQQVFARFEPIALSRDYKTSVQSKCTLITRMFALYEQSRLREIEG